MMPEPESSYRQSIIDGYDAESTGRVLGGNRLQPFQTGWGK